MESTLQQLQAEAQRGNAQAQYALGGAYYNGNGVIRNPAQGAQWLLRAADRRTLALMLAAYDSAEKRMSVAMR